MRRPRWIISFLLSALPLSAWCLHDPVAGFDVVGEIKVSTLATNLEAPWSIAFEPIGRIFVTERPGRVRLIINGTLLAEPLVTLQVAAVGEGGLLGMALDPDFSKTRHVYLYHTYQDSSGSILNRVIRLTERNNRLVDQAVILDRIPGASIHDGGRIKFGPDGKLYVTTGDAARSQLAQDLTSLAGKILRINKNGSVPADNPFPNSPVYSYGHRNPQGLDWHPQTGQLVATEHGPLGHDEVNLIEAGKNYGWPLIVGKGNDPNFVDPVIETGLGTWAPSAASFYDGRRIRDWTGSLFIATLRGAHLRVLNLQGGRLAQVESNIALLQGVYGRLREVVEGPDGLLYLTTSNRDGRGTPSLGDDRILRLSLVREFFEINVEGQKFDVSLSSNSSISDFGFSQSRKEIGYRVEGAEGTSGISTITFPRIMLGGPFTVLLDDIQIKHSESQNATHVTIAFNYSHSSRSVKVAGSSVIPEFSMAGVSLAAFMVLFLAIARIGRRICRLS